MSLSFLSTLIRLQHDLRLDSAILNQLRRISPRGLTDLLVHENVRIP